MEVGIGSHMNGSLVVRRCALEVATQTQSHMDPQLRSAVTKKLTTRLFCHTCHRMRSGCSEYSSYSISLPQHLQEEMEPGCIAETAESTVLP